MPEYSRCWNESCFLYGQLQPLSEDRKCEECESPLREEAHPALNEMGRDIAQQRDAQTRSK